jgi:hypothetical protein
MAPVQKEWRWWLYQGPVQQQQYQQQQQQMQSAVLEL